MFGWLKRAPLGLCSFICPSTAWQIPEDLSGSFRLGEVLILTGHLRYYFLQAEIVSFNLPFQATSQGSAAFMMNIQDQIPVPCQTNEKDAEKSRVDFLFKGEWLLLFLLSLLWIVKNHTLSGIDHCWCRRTGILEKSGCWSTTTYFHWNPATNYPIEVSTSGMLMESRNTFVHN